VLVQLVHAAADATEAQIHGFVGNLLELMLALNSCTLHGRL
jgi:hypothetical protein